MRSELAEVGRPQLNGCLQLMARTLLLGSERRDADESNAFVEKLTP